MDHASVIGGSDRVAISVDHATFEVEEADSVLGPGQISELSWRYAWDLHWSDRHQLAGASVSSPQPYALACPIPLVSVRRKASASVIWRMPS